MNNKLPQNVSMQHFAAVLYSIEESACGMKTLEYAL